MENKDSYTYKQYLWRKEYFKKESLAFTLVLFIGIVFSLFIFFIKNNFLYGVVTLVLTIPFIFSLYKYLIKDNLKMRARNYHTWGVGAGAELNVSQSLYELGEDYKIVSDFQTGRGNIDFIVIGPKGVFTIEVKAEKGLVSYQEDKLLINGKPIMKDYIKQTLAESLFLSDLLGKLFRKKYFVTGILEFPFGRIDTNTIHGQINNIWIGGYKFHEYAINKSKTYLSKEEMEMIHLYLKNVNLKEEKNKESGIIVK